MYKNCTSYSSEINNLLYLLIIVNENWLIMIIFNFTKIFKKYLSYICKYTVIYATSRSQTKNRPECIQVITKVNDITFPIATYYSHGDVIHSSYYNILQPFYNNKHFTIIMYNYVSFEDSSRSSSLEDSSRSSPENRIQNFWNQCAYMKNLRNPRQGDAVTGDDVPMTSTPYQKLQIFFLSANSLQKIWKNSWLFMVDIYSSVNFFRNFGANVLL